MTPKPTIRTIAERAGVSPMTVSRALNGARYVAAEKRKQIRAIARQLGYRPNPSARQLRAWRGPKEMDCREFIALLIEKKDPEWANSWKHRSYVAGVQRRATQFGYKVQQVWVYEPGWNVGRIRRLLTAANIRGTVLFPNHYQEIPDDILSLVARHSCAVLGGQPSKSPFHFAAIDDFASARTAARQALARGYRRPGLALLGWIDELIDRRYSAGFMSVQQDLPARERLPVLRLSSFSPEEFVRWYTKHRPDVIITHNRRIAVDEWLRPLRVSVPRDVGWITLDVIPGDDQVSGLDTRSEFVGAAALDLVLGQMQRDETGFPEFQKGVFIEGVWREGSTVRKTFSKSAKAARVEEA